MSLHIILYNIRDRLPLDVDIVYELQQEDYAVVCESLPLHLLAACGPKPRDLPCTLTHRVKNTRKVHLPKWFYNGVLSYVNIVI